jgi:hypothetical protein
MCTKLNSHFPKGKLKIIALTLKRNKLVTTLAARIKHTRIVVTHPGKRVV